MDLSHLYFSYSTDLGRRKEEGGRREGGRKYFWLKTLNSNHSIQNLIIQNFLERRLNQPREL
jgi:hypothetical protein